MSVPPTVSLPECQTGTSAGTRRTVNRLRRARGQLTALIAAVESESDCRHVITQLTAVRGALEEAGFELISTAMSDCLKDSTHGLVLSAVPSDSGQKPTLEEIRALFLRLT